MSCHEEYSLAMLTIEQENDETEKQREEIMMRAKASSIYCWQADSCILKKDHTGVCIDDVGW